MAYTFRQGLAIWAFWLGMAFFALYALGGWGGPFHGLWRAATFMFPDNATGTITSVGAGGDWTMHVDACQSGGRRNYWGVSFFDDGQKQLGGRLALPESGSPHILVNIPGQTGSIEYTREECTVWDADLQHTRTTYNGIWAIEGHAKFDCRGTDPVTHLVGDLKFRSCH